MEQVLEILQDIRSDRATGHTKTLGSTWNQSCDLLPQTEAKFADK